MVKSSQVVDDYGKLNEAVYSKYPIKVFLDEGILVVLGTDNAAVLTDKGGPGFAMREQVKYLHYHVGLIAKELASIARNGFTYTTAMPEGAKKIAVGIVNAWEAKYGRREAPLTVQQLAEL